MSMTGRRRGEPTQLCKFMGPVSAVQDLWPLEKLKAQLQAPETACASLRG